MVVVQVEWPRRCWMTLGWASELVIGDVRTVEGDRDAGGGDGGRPDPPVPVVGVEPASGWGGEHQLGGVGDAEVSAGEVGGEHLGEERGSVMVRRAERDLTSANPPT
jgi:hypothetical protein